MTQPSAGAIYDLGYRGYTGPRLGRASAVATLFWSSFRAAFGIGRSARAKIVPWGLGVIALLPAAIAVGITALVGERVAPFTYDNYLTQIQVALTLFVAAQAPELVGGDQRNHVLSLYFSHAIRRLDYAAAKLGALTAAVLLLTVVPQLVLFVGHVLSAADVLTALRDEAPKLVQVAVTSLLYSVTLAVIGLAIAAYTPRRAYATGAIIAVFLVSAIMGGILRSMDVGAMSTWGVLLDPLNVLFGVAHAIFGGPTSEFTNGRGVSISAEVPDIAYVGVLVGILAVGVVALWRRYTRIQA